MSNIATLIRAAARPLIVSALGSDWHELDFQTDPTRESKVTRDAGWSLLPGGLSPAPGTYKGSFGYAHRFFLVLTKATGVGPRSQKTTLVPAVETILENMHKALIALRQGKMGLPDVVKVFENPDIDDPEYVEDMDLIVLTAKIAVHVHISYE